MLNFHHIVLISIVLNNIFPISDTKYPSYRLNSFPVSLLAVLT